MFSKKASLQIPPDSLRWYALFYVLYTCFAFLGRSLSVDVFHFTPIWFAGAVYIIYFLYVPYNKWWKVILTAFLAHLSYAVTGPGEVSLRLFFFTSRTLEAIVGAYLFIHFVSSNSEVKSANQSIRLVLFTCLGSSLLSALVGSVTIQYFYTESNFIFTFVAWWSGDVLGLLIILSFYFARKREIQQILSINTRAAEAVFLGIAFLVLALFSLYFPLLRYAVGNLLIFPMLFYVAYRFRTVGLFVMTSFLIMLTIHGKTEWPLFFLYHNLRNELVFLSTITHIAIQYIALYLFIAMVNEREKTLADLKTREELFRLLAENSRDVIFKFKTYPSFSIEYISPAITTITGFTIPDCYQKPFAVLKKLFWLEKPRLLEIMKNPAVLNNPIIVQWCINNRRVIWVEQRSSVLYNSNGTLTNIEGTIRDISQSKHLEILAVLNRERLERAESVARLGSWEYNLSTGHVFWSEQLKKMTDLNEQGKSAEDILLEQIPVSHKYLAMEAFAGIKQDCQPRSLEHPFLTGDGRIIWVQSKANVVYNDKNQPERIIGSFLDITERIKREQEIQKQNETLATIFDNAPYLMLLINKEGKIVKANHEAILFSGQTVFKPEGQAPGDLFNCVNAIPYGSCGTHSMCCSCSIRTNLNAAIQTGTTVYNAEGNVEIVRDGVSLVKNLLISAVPLLQMDDIVLLTLADISGQRYVEGQLKESRLRYNFIVNNIEDVIWEVSPDYVYTNISKADEKQRGYTIDEVIGTNFFDYILPKYKTTVASRLNDIVTQITPGAKSSRVILEFEQRCKNGEHVWTEVVAYTAMSADGTLAGFHGVTREITERRKTVETSLAQAELYHQMFVDHSAIQLLLDAYTGKIVDANPAALAYYGYSHEHIQNISIAELYALPLEEITNLLDKVRDEKKRYLCAKHRLASGEFRDVEIYSAPLVVGNRKLLYSIIHDISDRVLTARKLEASEKKYKNIFEQSVDIMYRISLQGIFLAISPSATRILGYEEVEIIGHNINEFLTENSFQVSYDEFIKRSSSGDRELISKYEVELIAKNGQIKILEINSKLFEEGAMQLSILGIARDITDRRRFEAVFQENEFRFKSVWNQSVDGMRIINQFGEIIMVNDAFCKLVDKKRENLIGNLFSVIYKNGEDKPDIYNSQTPMYTHFMERIEENSIEAIMERKVELWNNRTVWLEISNSIIKGEGNAKQILSIFRDISERKRALFAIEKANVEMQELIQTKNRFMSILSHDLRGPFHGFLGLSKLLRDELDSLTKDEIVEIAGELHSALNGQYELLNELLDWSKIQTGRMKFNPEDVLLKPEFQNIYNQFLPLIAMKQVFVSFLVDEKVKIFCDVHMLRLLIRNTLSNAIKFSNPGGTVQLKFETAEEFDTVIVQDEGIGMSEELKNELFKLNKASSREGTAGEKGTGIGLVLCKEIMLRHGGDIYLRSTEGEGTKVILQFPKTAATE